MKSVVILFVEDPVELPRVLAVIAENKNLNTKIISLIRLNSEMPNLNVDISTLYGDGFYIDEIGVNYFVESHELK